MQSSVSFLVLVICLAQLAHSATISEVQAKLETELQYIDEQLAETRANIAQTVTAGQAAIKNRAEAIKTEINNGSEGCKVWASQVESVQINFMYALQYCQMAERLNNIEYLKSNIRNQVEKLALLCPQTTLNCQYKIDGMFRNLDNIHRSVTSQLLGARMDANSCVFGKSKEINEKLDAAYNSWKLC